MKIKRIVIAAVMASLILLCISVYAQMSRPYRNGSVWNIAFIRVKPGMNAAYLNYLASGWKKEQEALKKDGLILSYKVMATEGHSGGDWNLLLMTEYKDLATMEANEPKADAMAQRVVGDDQKQMQGYKDRADMREVLGERLAREIVLEPRPQ
ncbi:MAG: hypothetical protein LAO21_20565 [Acidobacteriia bacterium]|nr:hypothetical protein [Terriglobia bacterium]